MLILGKPVAALGMYDAQVYKNRQRTLLQVQNHYQKSLQRSAVLSLWESADTDELFCTKLWMVWIRIYRIFSSFFIFLVNCPTNKPTPLLIFWSTIKISFLLFFRYSRFWGKSNHLVYVGDSRIEQLYTATRFAFTGT